MRCVAFGAYTPAPPGPKREGTDPSVNTWISDGGREDSPLEAIWSRDVLLPEQSGMKGETLKWVVDHGGKGGHVIRDSRGDGSGCVAEEQNDLQEGFFYSRQGTFLNCQGIKAGEVRGKAQSTFKGVEGLML